MVGEIAVWHERTDAQTAARRLFHRLERQTRDVDQPHRALDIVLHQVDEIGAAGDKSGLRIGGDLTDSIGDIGRP